MLEKLQQYKIKNGKAIYGDLDANPPKNKPARPPSGL